MSMAPTILDFAYAIDFLNHLVQSSSRPTTLIICHDRVKFLNQIHTSIPSSAGDEDVLPDTDQTIQTVESKRKPHPLLTPTLQLVARSHHIKLVFCPRIDIFRAFIAGKLSVPSLTDTEKPILAVLDLVALHARATDFSAQVLSRSFALLVESAARSQMDLIVNECIDPNHVEHSHHGPNLWETQIPLLSGSVKLAGNGNAWAGRAISAKQVAERWFNFQQIPKG